MCFYFLAGPGETKGGMSWTREWLKFDNSYFRELKDAKEGRADPELLRMYVCVCVVFSTLSSHILSKK